MNKILLASNSPRRRQLLALTGFDFRVQAVDIDETPFSGEPPAEYARRLAESKGLAALEIAEPQEIILASDTIVADGNELLGKPTDAAQARQMLRQLRNREHQVFTAVAFVADAGKQVLSDVCVASVPMRNYSDAEIEAYIDSGDPFDKAGAYAIQHAGFHPVVNFEGCFACVMGLPVCHVLRIAARMGLVTAQDVPQACQQVLDYSCSVFADVLSSSPVLH